jgi:hypothetical protein
MAAWFVVAQLDELRIAAVLGVGALAGVAVVWPPARRWLPERACQVPSALMHFPPGRAAFRWGLDLGTGVSTFVVTPGMYALLAVAVGQARPMAVVGLCALYGACRGAAIAWFALVLARRRETTERSPGVGLERSLRMPLAIAILVAAVAAAGG